MNSKILKRINADQYYPTPEAFIKKLVGQIDISDKSFLKVLEPTAGDGAIARVIKEEYPYAEIDCVEINKVLSDSLKGQKFNVVGTDFETYNSAPFYNLIIMNPPFNKGDKFCLKAYDLLTGNGQLICLLNAETIKNPFSKDRKILKDLIDKNGEVEFYTNIFGSSENSTKVEVAVVHLSKPLYGNEFDLFGDIKQEVLTEDEKIREKFSSKVEDLGLITVDKVDNAINLYRNAVKQMFQSVETINNIKTSLSYLQDEMKEFNVDINEFIEIMLKHDRYSDDDPKEDIIKKIRKLVWSFVIKKCKMDKYLFYKQKNELYTNIDKGSQSLPFTKENISQFFNTIFLKREELFKEGIVDLFNEVTGYHSGNSYHRDGWKTNKNWKINKKIIMGWGIRFEEYGDSFRVPYSGYDWLDDLDKIVRQIDPMHSWTIKEALAKRFEELGKVPSGSNFDNTCETAYFNLKFHKKGSLHISFKDEKVLKELNKIGASVRTDLGYDDFGKKQ